MRKRWGHEIASQIQDYKDHFNCYKELKWFPSSAFTILQKKTTSLIRISKPDRRARLATMLGLVGYFHIDGRHVCKRFLDYALHLGIDLQSSIPTKRATTSMSTTLIASIRRLVSLSLLTDRSAPERDASFLFLEKLAEKSTNLMPDHAKTRFLYFSKASCLRSFPWEYERLREGAPFTKKYFVSTRRPCCLSNKVLKIKLFFESAVCKQINVAIRNAFFKHKTTKELKKRMLDHTKMVTSEIREYYKKKNRSILHPS